MQEVCVSLCDLEWLSRMRVMRVGAGWRVGWRGLMCCVCTRRGWLVPGDVAMLRGCAR